MKLFILALTLTTSVFAQTRPKIVCTNESDSHVNIDLDSARGMVSFNFSSAFISCPSAVETYVERKMPFNCAGMWSHSNLENVVVKFIPNDSGYLVKYRTSKVYGKELEVLIVNLNKRISSLRIHFF